MLVRKKFFCRVVSRVCSAVWSRPRKADRFLGRVCFEASVDSIVEGVDAFDDDFIRIFGTVGSSR